MNKLAIIIPTRDRSKELVKLLFSIRSQDIVPQQTVIVDSSKMPNETIVQEFSDLNIVYKYTQPPSLTKQRNVGLSLLRKDIELVIFFDDDIVLCPSALKIMLDFWESALPKVGGVVFNIINERSGRLWWLKQIFFTGCKKPG
ncbi:MAG: glycosyltransferase family 2 protein, partial [Candidatus Omnitrophica bacterium]|nr:glycosyltransferase family 2 protein [Candidatus Omnitrophota bacterium]